MNASIIMSTAVFFPILLGAILLFMPEFRSRNRLLGIVGAGVLITGLMAFLALAVGETNVSLLCLGEKLEIAFRLDKLGRVFTLLVTIIWVMTGLYSFAYMKHEKEEKRYFGFYLMTFGALLALAFAGNIVTYYLFYELMTLLSVPLVLHTRTREAVMGGLKYLLYSLCGAYMVLLGLFFLSRYATTFYFTAGGVLNGELTAENEKVLLIVVFFMIIGFGVKAGMFPLHAWLSAAHPVAPAPASAVLSGLIVKAGVLGMIRTVYFLFGADFIRGTWVQTVWIVLTLITIFMGSMLAYREKILKKRLAYSTVSQVSYILLGLALLQPQAMTGALLHTIFHAFIKATLFLSAGAIVYKTEKTNVDDMTGIGKEMPLTIWCYTFASLALIGIPPASGFVSKWYLAEGALLSNTGVFTWLGPAVLLLSALLTAGYLLPVTIKGFLPGADFDYGSLQKKDPDFCMMIPLLLFAALSILFGVFPNPLIGYLETIVGAVL